MAKAEVTKYSYLPDHTIMLISDTSSVRKNYFNFNIKQNENARILRCSQTLLKWTSPKVKCLHRTSSRREMSTFSFYGMNYHNFSHSAPSYTLNGENVRVMLEFKIDLVPNS